MTKSKKPVSTGVQLLVSFVLPTIALVYFSDETRLGPLWGMAVALVPPVLLELYTLATTKKSSILSMFAIVGILLIGVISLLGLSEEWLGVRRAAIYVVGAVAVLLAVRYKRNWLDKALATIIDMEMVRVAAKQRRVEKLVERRTTKTAMATALFLAAMAVWSYILTIVVISAPTGSSEFNAQYAQLRILSIPLQTLPFLVGLVAIVLYLLNGIEKLTGLDIEQLVKKKR